LLKWADYFGNDAHGIALPYNYLRVAEWHSAFATAGLVVLPQRPFLKLSYEPCKHILYHLEKSAEA
jgi:hypothetical protein